MNKKLILLSLTLMCLFANLQVFTMEVDPYLKDVTDDLDDNLHTSFTTSYLALCEEEHYRNLFTDYSLAASCFDSKPSREAAKVEELIFGDVEVAEDLNRELSILFYTKQKLEKQIKRRKNSESSRELLTTCNKQIERKQRESERAIKNLNINT